MTLINVKLKDLKYSNIIMYKYNKQIICVVLNIYNASVALSHTLILTKFVKNKHKIHICP